MKKEDLIFDEERKNRIYAMSVEKILEADKKKVRLLAFVSAFSTSLAVLLLVITIFFSTGVIPGKTVTVDTSDQYVEFQEEFSERYEEFFSLSESTDTSDLYGDLFSE